MGEFIHNKVIGKQNTSLLALNLVPSSSYKARSLRRGPVSRRLDFIPTASVDMNVDLLFRRFLLLLMSSYNNIFEENGGANPNKDDRQRLLCDLLSFIFPSNEDRLTSNLSNSTKYTTEEGSLCGRVVPGRRRRSPPRDCGHIYIIGRQN